MALIPLLALAFLAMIVLLVGLGAVAVIAIVALLVKYERLRRIVIPASLAIATVVTIYTAAKARAVHLWPQAALKLAPLAMQVNPVGKKFSPFSNYASYAKGYENYVSLTADQRMRLAGDIQLKLAGLPSYRFWGFRPGSKHWDRDFEYRQSTRYHQFDDDEAMTPVRGAAWWVMLKKLETQIPSNPRFYRQAYADNSLGEKFLARLAKRGNKDAACDLALLVTKGLDAPDTSGNSRCRIYTLVFYKFEDEQCDLFDPLKGHGLYASLFRTWSSIAQPK